MLQKFAHLGLQSIGWIYHGQTLEDPINGRTYRKMLPYGRVRTRPNALSPHSLSLERHRALWVFLSEFTDFFTSSARMLHMAPEYCFIKRFRSVSSLDYVTGDIDAAYLDRLDKARNDAAKHQSNDDEEGIDLHNDEEN